MANKSIKNKSNDKSLRNGEEKSKKKTPTWLADLRYGRSVSVDLFRKNAWLLLLILTLTIALMGLRYKTKTKMAEIKYLQKELRHAESEKLREKAEYMSLIRENEMQRLVSEKKLGLTFQDQPPYSVKAVNE